MSNPIYKIIDIAPIERTYKLGRFGVKGFDVPVTTGVNNPWIFKGFMVTTAGNVVVINEEGDRVLYPACQPGVQYWAVGIQIATSGTTATGIYVYGGV